MCAGSRGPAPGSLRAFLMLPERSSQLMGASGPARFCAVCAQNGDALELEDVLLFADVAP